MNIMKKQLISLSCVLDAKIFTDNLKKKNNK